MKKEESAVGAPSVTPLNIDVPGLLHIKKVFPCLDVQKEEKNLFLWQQKSLCSREEGSGKKKLDRMYP